MIKIKRRKRVIKTKITPNKSNRRATVNRTNITRKTNHKNYSLKKSYSKTTSFLPRNSNRVFIIGGGPSVLNVDLSLLKNEDVICFNKSIDLIDNPTYFITMDYTFFDKIGREVKEVVLKAKSSHFIVNAKGNHIKEVNGILTDTRFNLKYRGVEWFSSIISSTDEFNSNIGFGNTINTFAHGNNSGFCAIQFAILAGYTEIYLIGFDMKVSKKSHFHDEYANIGKTEIAKRINKYSNVLIKALSRFNRNNKDVFIKTLTPSNIPENHLPYVTLNEILKQKSDIKTEKPLQDLVIVAYYTINTPYEVEANKLKSSLAKLGLNFDVVGVKNLGNWQANTRFKAKFMEDMLNKHTSKNLLYVDSDAIVHKKPVLFNNYDCDIAVRWQDFRWRKNECLSGTIFMANNEKTRELCKRWASINKKEGPNATTFEQWNLGKVIKDMEREGKIKSKNLPPEYTFIFDSMRKMYPKLSPVIEHFQASRRLKNKIK